MKPMKAKEVEWHRLVGRYPFFIQPKLDGIRCVVKDGVALSNSLKKLPNKYLQSTVASGEYDGMDGELMLGSWTEGEVFKRTHSAVMTEAGEPDLKLALFDFWNCAPDTPFEERMMSVNRYINEPDSNGFVIPVFTSMVWDESEAKIVHQEICEQGYEGSMLRDPAGTYKFGRSTPKEAKLLKVKDFVDREAKVIDFLEKMTNENEQTINELGMATRSSHKEGKIPAGVLGKFLVEWDGDEHTPGGQFKIGSGLTDADRKEIWDNKVAYVGKTIVFKYQPTPGYENPRAPIFKGFRDPIDLD